MNSPGDKMKKINQIKIRISWFIQINLNIIFIWTMCQLHLLAQSSDLKSKSSSKSSEPIATKISSATIRELVQKVGDDEGWVDAYNQLAKLGLSAQKELLERIHDPQPRRARLYQELLTKAVQADINKKKKNYQIDQNWQHFTSISTWNLYLSIVGDNEESKALWREMIEAEPELFIWFDLDESLFYEKLSAEIKKWEEFDPDSPVYSQDALLNLKKGNLSAFYFFASLKQFQQKLEKDNIYISDILFHTDSDNSLNDLTKNRTQRKLFIQWLKQKSVKDNDNNKQEPYLYYIINQHQIKEAHSSLMKSLKSNDSSNPWAKLNILQNISNQLLPKDIPLLVSMMKKNNRAGKIGIGNGFGSTTEYEFRDIILLNILQILKKKPETFGFTKPETVDNFWGTHGYYFTDENQRIFAFKQWNQYYAKEMKKKNPFADAKVNRIYLKSVQGK